MSKNPVMHRTSKHTDVRYPFVRERVQDVSLKLVFIPSSENIADILTKATRRHVFLDLRDKAMLDPGLGLKQKPGKAMLAMTETKEIEEDLHAHWEVAFPEQADKPKPQCLMLAVVRPDPSRDEPPSEPADDAEEDFLRAIEEHVAIEPRTL